MARDPRRQAGPGGDLLVVSLTFAVLGVLGAVVWSTVVTPAMFTKVAGGAAMSENQLGRAFGADGWFVLIGVVGTLVAAAVLTWWRTADPVRMVVLLLVGSLAAAVLTAWLGYLLGPTDPRTALESAKVGARLPTSLRLGARPLHPFGDYVKDTVVFYLAWPIGALVGALVALLGRSAPTGPVGDEPLSSEAASR